MRAVAAHLAASVLAGNACTQTLFRTAGNVKPPEKFPEAPIRVQYRVPDCYYARVITQLHIHAGPCIHP